MVWLVCFLIPTAIVVLLDFVEWKKPTPFEIRLIIAFGLVLRFLFWFLFEAGIFTGSGA